MLSPLYFFWIFSTKLPHRSNPIFQTSFDANFTSQMLRIKTVHPFLRCLDLGKQWPNQTRRRIRELLAPSSSSIASVEKVSSEFPLP